MLKLKLKIATVLLLTVVFGNSCLSPDKPELPLIDLVNPLMGTDSDFSLSNGNTYPAIATPWGMNFWSPQTGEIGNGWGYTYDANKIRGIKQTHQPSPWINDYGAFSFMAVTGALKFMEEERASWFSHKTETVKPNYYSVYLADHDVTVEVTPTERAAIFRFTFPETDSAYILLDAFFRGSEVKIDSQNKRITGYARNNSGGVPDNFHNYFVAEFSKDFSEINTWDKDELKPGNKEANGEHVGAAVGFKTKRGEQIIVKVASSFISPEQALLNLNQEIGNKNFEEVKNQASELWEKELQKIKIKGGTTNQQKTFYSCLYRVLLFPRKFYEINEIGEVVHYSPYNGKVLPGYMFTDNGFWDTFRAVFPFFTLMYPELDSHIMQGLVNTYKESSWLPEWASPGHRDCMIGSNSASLIADAYLKGIRGFDAETLFEAMLKNTGGNMEGVSSVGRYGAEYYNKLGYIPYDVGINENTARTLEYAYADFCLLEMGKELGHSGEELSVFEKRQMNYKNVFDEETGFMRGRNEDGSFQSPFSLFKWGDAFTEGNSLHYTWSVFHDIAGLKKLMGGDKKFVATLDTVFALPPVFDCSYYGFPIHEIREMQIVNMGNYAHGNQPVQHMVYLYNYAGEPWKTQKHVRNILTKLYTPQPDGYCGDEDNGQTSAWYVFSVLGFYPVCPGSGQYVIGSPLFDEAVLTFSNGNKLIISSQNNTDKKFYVNECLFNGKKWDKNFLDHADLIKGGKLEFKMSNIPNLKRGTTKNAFPFSVSDF
ncbi:MAG: GH92 family glycosyl hydrolase [Prolixibacteraceae bacterium]|nr:GH92 family glycosyl hydrolase [Prolixibacteraceae bacterium]MBN2773102.1 GH92 family glycosyl hydrolase [Prolixibacteraceae bacterium]